MVLRDSKYKSNKKCMKKSFWSRYHKTQEEVEEDNKDNWQTDFIYQSRDGNPIVWGYTDNSHYERIDKKKQRKKLYKKSKSTDEEEEDIDVSNLNSIKKQKKIKIMTQKDCLTGTQVSTGNEDLDELLAKDASRKITSNGIKKIKVEGNLNKILHDYDLQRNLKPGKDNDMIEEKEPASNSLNLNEPSKFSYKLYNKGTKQKERRRRRNKIMGDIGKKSDYQ